MATLHQTTASEPVEVTDEEGVEDLLEGYRIWVEVTLEDGQLGFHGYDGFQVEKEIQTDPPESLYEDVTRKFLHELTEYIADGSELIIQTVGYEKCRFPVVAYQYRVTPEGVFYSSLNQEEKKLEVAR